MKTSNKLLAGLLIVIIILTITNMFLFRNAMIEGINNNPKQKIELNQE